MKVRAKRQLDRAKLIMNLRSCLRFVGPSSRRDQSITLWTAWSWNTIPPTGYQSAVARGEPGALATPRRLRSWGQRSWVQIPPAPPQPYCIFAVGHDVLHWNATQKM